jgi:hypothetical protein
MKTKCVVGGIVGLVVLLFAVSGFGQAGKGQTAKPRKYIFSDKSGQAKSVQELWAKASAVVVAELMSSRTVAFQATPSGQLGVVTYHQMLVLQTAKDNTGLCQEGHIIEVIEEAGEYDAGDHILEVVPEDEVRLKTGKPAILFLVQRGPRLPLAICDSRFGAYKLDDDGRVMLKHLPGEDADFEAFVQRLRGMKKTK